MTTEEKAKAYDEVLEKAKAHINRKGIGDTVDLCKNLFSELRESEDDRIRKDIVSHFESIKAQALYDNQEMSQDIISSCNEKIAYLEKQKDNKFAPRVLPCSAAWFEDGEEKQKEQNPAEIHIDNPNIQKLNPDVVVETRTDGTGDIDGKALLYTADKSYKIGFRDGVASVKPADVDEYKIIKKHITEDSLSSEVNKRLKECGWYVTDEKPAEWSEEDEDMLNSCISSIEEAKENRYAYKETDGDTSYDHEIAWLKLLRNRVGKEFLQPHWKPSEDEERLIKTSISFLKDFADKGYENAVECIDWLKSKLNGNAGK